MTERSTHDAVSSVAGNCPSGTGPMRSVGAGADVDHNRDGYSCVRRGISIAGEHLLFEIDNDAASARGASQRDPVWDGLYTGL